MPQVCVACVATGSRDKPQVISLFDGLLSAIKTGLLTFDSWPGQEIFVNLFHGHRRRMRSAEKTPNFSPTLNGHKLSNKAQLLVVRSSLSMPTKGKQKCV